MAVNQSDPADSSSRQSLEQGTAYLIGGGIASLAAAVYLIRDVGLSGDRIHIFSRGEFGGSLDANDAAGQGYSMRGSRMFGAAYVRTYDLLASIPSLDNPEKSVIADTFEFWQASPWHDKARLIDRRGIVDLSSWRLDNDDRVDLMRLMLFAEEKLNGRSIEGCFRPHFFSTSFWLMWSTMFGFETWHSAVELRRYLLRLLRLIPDLETLKIIQSTRYSSYHSIVLPLIRWLEARGVQLESGVQVTDLEFTEDDGDKSVQQIKLERASGSDSIAPAAADIVLITLGSMTANWSLGSMTRAPAAELEKASVSWTLWQRLADKDPAFGRPEVFCSDVERSKWVTFTVTDSGDSFVKRIEALTSSPPGRGGLTTLVSANWLITFHLFHPPAYPDQPEGVHVWWGYGMYPDREGNFVQKKMTECTGKEILTEVYGHLGFESETADLLADAICIPCLLPFTTSQFMPRSVGDRPLVIPAGTRNLAVIGQYCEMPDDITYTMEYSVSSARSAVLGLFGLEDHLPPTYKGLEHPYALVTALKRILD